MFMYKIFVFRITEAANLWKPLCKKKKKFSLKESKASKCLEEVKEVPWFFTRCCIRRPKDVLYKVHWGCVSSTSQISSNNHLLCF